MKLSDVVIYKAWSATVVFAIAGIVGFLIAPFSLAVCAQVIFYSVLTLNTFYSVRLFLRLEPRTVEQFLIDTALGCTYMALGFSIGHAWSFAFCALSIFVLAPIKYIRMLDVVPHTRFLRKKLTIDILGTILCTVVMGIVISGYGTIGMWVLAIVFALANIYFLRVDPMYRL